MAEPIKAPADDGVEPGRDPRITLRHVAAWFAPVIAEPRQRADRVLVVRPEEPGLPARPRLAAPRVDGPARALAHRK